MPFEELLDWSNNQGRPPWQRDALRRLAESAELTEDDLAALRLQIEAAEGLAEAGPDPVPLAAGHLSEAAGNAPKTVLASLGPVSHVDRLEPGQPPLRFAINGITLVYGANASGKSGYCRIAKQLCRTVSPGTLRGNVYDAAAALPPEVAVAFRVGADDDPKTELVWRGDEAPPAELARISVFDTGSARVYVDSERKIEFLPYELDLLNKLGLAARTLDAAFRQRVDAVEAQLRIALPAGYTEGTAVSQLIDRLVALHGGYDSSVGFG